jgi:hypothetical protein
MSVKSATVSEPSPFNWETQGSMQGPIRDFKWFLTLAASPLILEPYRFGSRSNETGRPFLARPHPIALDQMDRRLPVMLTLVSRRASAPKCCGIRCLQLMSPADVSFIAPELQAIVTQTGAGLPVGAVRYAITPEISSRFDGDIARVGVNDHF